MAGTSNKVGLPEGGSEQSGEQADEGRRAFIGQILAGTAVATTALMGFGQREALADEVQLAQGETQIASMLENIVFEPESTKITFGNTFPILKGRAAHYQEVFNNFSSKEQILTLRIFHAGYADTLSPSKKARLLMGSLNFVESIGNLSTAIETGRLDLSKDSDIERNINSLITKYPGTEGIITPEFSERLLNLAKAAEKSLKAKNEQLKQELEVLKSILNPGEKV